MRRCVEQVKCKQKLPNGGAAFDYQDVFDAIATKFGHNAGFAMKITLHKASGTFGLLGDVNELEGETLEFNDFRYHLAFKEKEDGGLACGAFCVHFLSHTFFFAPFSLTLNSSCLACNR